MFQLLEIVGVSKVGYSEAIKDAIERIKQSGENVYWFEVLEQRGGIKNDIVEFQIKLKVAVSVEQEEEKGLFVCSSCGMSATRSDSLCNPEKV